MHPSLSQGDMKPTSRNFVTSLASKARGQHYSRTSMSSNQRKSNQRKRNDSTDDEEGGYGLQSDTESEFSPPNSPITKSAVGKQNKKETTEDYQLEDGDESAANIPSPEGAHYKQNIAPFSTLFCAVQCIILTLMMWQCGLAPLNINPMIGPYPVCEKYC